MPNTRSRTPRSRIGAAYDPVGVATGQYAPAKKGVSAKSTAATMGRKARALETARSAGRTKGISKPKGK